MASYKDLYMQIFYVLEKFDIFRNVIFQPSTLYNYYNIQCTIQR